MSYPAEIRVSDVIQGLDIRFLIRSGMMRFINDYRTTGKMNPMIKIHLIGTFIISLPYMVFQCLSLFKVQYDIKKGTFVILHPMAAFQIYCRILVLWFNIERQGKLYNIIRKDFLNIPKEMSHDASELYKKQNRTSNLCCNATFLWNASIELVYIFFPGVSVDYIENREINKKVVNTGKNKIFSGWYPVPMSEYPYYEIIYIYEAMCLLWASTLLGLYFCMYFQLLMCLCTQYVALGYRVANLKIDPVIYKLDKKYKSSIYQELCQIVKDHQKLLSYTDELTSVYNPLVTMTLGIGIAVLIIGAIQFLLGKTSDPEIIFKLIQMFSFRTFFEVSMFCFGSSRIEEASSDLQDAIYSSDWYKADTNFKIGAQMMMIRAKKRVNLTALFLYPVNLATLGSIVQFTYSCSALMSGMAE
ncbi:odorant receptor 24a [Halyomorpha halys]|uniref:odorant receptor 24a n=1 Tax=Halyomorpha halys TaxID=286706 RepID=UPI0006D52939|nr:odorant receptor 24a-like [Halyomorpha halys]KAE8573609.1 Odorant receptor 68 [Halyomorpha halys]